jgi:hypothetical protein
MWGIGRKEKSQRNFHGHLANFKGEMTVNDMKEKFVNENRT